MDKDAQIRLFFKLFFIIIGVGTLVIAIGSENGTFSDNEAIESNETINEIVGDILNGTIEINETVNETSEDILNDTNFSIELNESLFDISEDLNNNSVEVNEPEEEITFSALEVKEPPIDFSNLEIFDRSENSDTYSIGNGTYVSIISSALINMKDMNGVYRPYEEVTSFTATEDELILKWNNKSVNLKLYTKDKDNNKEKFSEKDYMKKRDLKFKTNIEKKRGGYYFNHTLDKTKQPKKIGYEIVTENVDCFVERYSLICDEQKINFEQAVFEQNLTVEINNDFVEISGADLSYIDPVITQYAWLTHTYCDDQGSSPGFDFDPDVLNDIGTDEISGGREYCNGLIEFPVTGFSTQLEQTWQIDSVYFSIKTTASVISDEGNGVAVDFCIIDNIENYDTSPDTETEREDIYNRLESCSSTDFLFAYSFLESGDNTRYSWRIDNLDSKVASEIIDNMDGSPSNSLSIGMEGETDTNDEEKVDFYDEFDGTDAPYITVNYHLPTPTTTHSATSPPGSGAYSSNTWTNDNVQHSISCGVECTYVQYCTTSSSCTPGGNYGVNEDVTISSEGTTYFRWRGVYTGTSTYYGSISQYIDKIDKTAPTTTATATSPLGGANYAFGTETNEDVQITLSCSDGSGSGCNTGLSKYCLDIDNTCTPATVYSSMLDISTLGTSYIRYSGEDNVGNAESVKSSKIIIEKDYPTNTSVYINNSEFWSLGGYLEDTETIGDFTLELNNFLSNCVADSEGYCDIPITIHSDKSGIINISNIDINYNINEYSWDITNLPWLSTYKTRIRATDGYFNSSWDESDADFNISVNSLSIASTTTINKSDVESGNVQRGDNVTINATVIDADAESEVDSVWIKVWKGAIGASIVIWQGFMSFISGDLWSVEIETNESFNLGENNYTVYANNSVGDETNFSGSFLTVLGAPNSLLCDGNNCTNNNTFYNDLNLSCSGSFGNNLTYYLEASYGGSGTWWNDSWDGRKEITITENSGNNLTNYSVLINVSKESEMSSDFSDVRFIDGDGVTELGYFFEDYGEGDGTSYENLVNTTGLVSYYKLDETSGTTAIDSHGTNNGTTTGAVVNQAGKLGTAYDFDGTDDHISIPNNVGASSQGSISAWINVDALTGEPEVILGAGIGFEPWIMLTIESNGQVSFVVQAQKSVGTPAGAVTAGTWYHVVYTSDGISNSNIYIDGVNQDLTGTQGGWLNDIAFTQLAIGILDRDTDYGAFDGKIDEVGIWNRSLSDLEVSELYNAQSANFYVKIPTLIASTDTTIGMYYNNSLATSNSDPNNAFLFYDDFEDNSFDTGLWTALNGSVTESGGDLVLNTNTFILSTQSVLSGDFELNFSYENWDDTASEIYTLKLNNDSGAEDIARIYTGDGGSGNEDSCFEGVCSTSSYVPAYDLSVKRHNGNWTLYRDGVQQSTETVNTTEDLFIGFGRPIGHSTGTLNFVKARKYTDLEPTVTFGLGASGSWEEIGNHTENSSFIWDISSIPAQSGVDLRCRAKENLTYSEYYSPGINLTIGNDTTSPNITSITTQNETEVEDGEVMVGDSVIINATVNDTGSGVDSVWIKIWQGAIGVSVVIWQGFMSFISGELWSVEIETNSSFNIGENNYTIYANDSSGNEVNSSNSFNVVNLTLANDTNKFIIQNSTGDIVAWMGDSGNILLKGICIVSTNCTAPSGSFIIQNSTGDVVAYLGSDGNLCIETGDCSDFSTSCNPTVDAFIIQNSSSVNMSYIDSDGDLCLTGRIYENVIF